MHPLITRYLDLSKLVATIEKAGQAVALDADEAALMAALAKEPKLKDELLKAKGKAQPSGTLQQRAIILSVQAATRRLFDDAALGPKAKAALAVLEAEGASAEEGTALVSQVLLDEAFGYAEDPTEFDAAYVAETLETLVPLAKLNADLVDDWLEAWAKSGPAAEKALRITVGEALLDAAWSEGPMPIAPEHVDDTIDHLGDTVASADRIKSLEALRGFIAFLAQQQVLGAERARRLTHLVDGAVHGPALSDEEEPVDEDEDAGDASAV
jgi:hypothetical protein